MSRFVLSAFADEIAPDLATQMDVLERHGIAHIEMRKVDGKGLVEDDLEGVRAIRRRLTDRGFALSAVGSPLGKIGILDDFGTHLDLFKHTLEIARIMECKNIRLFSFYIPKGDDPAGHRDEVLRRLHAFIEEARGTGVILCHENEKDIYGDTAERSLDLMRSLGCASFRMVFDPANFIQCGVETYPHAFDLLEDHIEYMHIKDAVKGSGRVVPAGHGDGRLRDILSRLNGNGFEGFLSIEPHLGAFEGLSDLELEIDLSSLPRSDEGTFAVAAGALKGLLAEIEGRK